MVTTAIGYEINLKNRVIVLMSASRFWNCCSHSVLSTVKIIINPIAQRLGSKVDEAKLTSSVFFDHSVTSVPCMTAGIIMKYENFRPC